MPNSDINLSPFIRKFLELSMREHYNILQPSPPQNMPAAPGSPGKHWGCTLETNTADKHRFLNAIFQFSQRFSKSQEFLQLSQNRKIF